MGEKGAREGPTTAALSLGAEALSRLGPCPWLFKGCWFHGPHRDHRCGRHLCTWREERLNRSVWGAGPRPPSTVCLYPAGA